MKPIAIVLPTMSLFSSLSFTFGPFCDIRCFVDGSLEHSRVSPIFLHSRRQPHLVRSHTNIVSTVTAHGLFTTEIVFEVVDFAIDSDVLLGRDWLNLFLSFVNSPLHRKR